MVEKLRVERIGRFLGVARAGQKEAAVEIDLLRQPCGGFRVTVTFTVGASASQ